MYAKNQLCRCPIYHTKRAVPIRSLRRRPYRMKPTAVGFISLTTVCPWYAAGSSVLTPQCKTVQTWLLMYCSYSSLALNHEYKIHPDSKVHGAHLGPTGPRLAPCWPHELCYLDKVPTLAMPALNTGMGQPSTSPHFATTSSLLLQFLGLCSSRLIWLRTRPL